MGHEFLEKMRAKLAKVSWLRYERIVVVDGLLLFHEASLHQRFDIMLLLRASREEAWRRRRLRYPND